jgi:hypothetical protein
VIFCVPVTSHRIAKKLNFSDAQIIGHQRSRGRREREGRRAQDGRQNHADTPKVSAEWREDGQGPAPGGGYLSPSRPSRR